jgi:hypothetical protein
MARIVPPTRKVVKPRIIVGAIPPPPPFRPEQGLQVVLVQTIRRHQSAGCEARGAGGTATGGRIDPPIPGAIRNPDARAQTG